MVYMRAKFEGRWYKRKCKCTVSSAKKPHVDQGHMSVKP